jgi:hypothetical protein
MQSTLSIIITLYSPPPKIPIRLVLASVAARDDEEEMARWLNVVASGTNALATFRLAAAAISSVIMHAIGLGLLLDNALSVVMMVSRLFNDFVQCDDGLSTMIGERCLVVRSSSRVTSVGAVHE